MGRTTPATVPGGRPRCGTGRAARHTRDSGARGEGRGQSLASCAAPGPHATRPSGPTGSKLPGLMARSPRSGSRTQLELGSLRSLLRLRVAAIRPAPGGVLSRPRGRRRGDARRRRDLAGRPGARRTRPADTGRAGTAGGRRAAGHGGRREEATGGGSRRHLTGPTPPAPIGEVVRQLVLRVVGTRHPPGERSFVQAVPSPGSFVQRVRARSARLVSSRLV